MIVNETKKKRVSKQQRIIDSLTVNNAHLLKENKELRQQNQDLMAIRMQTLSNQRKAEAYNLPKMSEQLIARLEANNTALVKIIKKITADNINLKALIECLK